MSKNAAKEIVESLLKKSPLAILLLASSAKEAFADSRERGPAYTLANQMFPVKLIDEMAEKARQDMFRWLDENRFSLFKNKFLHGGFSEEEAEQEAWKFIPRSGE